MSWKIEFYAGVKKAIKAKPTKLKAPMIRLLELIEEEGANGEPHTKAMGDGLFEIRLKEMKQ